MYPVSEEFLAALRHSHVAIARVDVLENRQVIETLTRVTAGETTVDANGETKRAASVALADPLGTLTPSSYADLLAPGGNEVRLWRGLSNFSEEMVPLITGQIDSVQVEGGSEGGVFIKLMAFDRSKAVSEAGFDTTYVVTAATNYGTAIQALISSRVPGLEYRFASTASTTPLLIFHPGDDPWKKALEMAESIGMKLDFDGLGVCVMEPVPDVDAAPVVFSYAEGEAPKSILLRASKALTRQYTYNGVVVTGETPTIEDQATAPVTATVWDDNPSSPTYYLGKFGRRPRRYASPFVTTVDQAMSAGRAILNSSLGLAESVTFESIVNPAHEPADVVDVLVTDVAVNARYIMDAFTIPLLFNQNLNATCRRRST